MYPKLPLHIVDLSKWKMTTGLCVDCNGVDQNDGQISLQGLNEQQCLQKCTENANVKGCEHSGTSCYIHTKEVSKGNGRANFKCWSAPTNCQGKYYPLNLGNKRCGRISPLQQLNQTFINPSFPKPISM